MNEPTVDANNTSTMPDSGSPTTDDDRVLKDLQSFLSGSNNNNNNHSLFDEDSVAVPVAAIQVLLRVVERTKAYTMMGLQNELQDAAQQIIHYNNNNNNHIISQLALQSGCELFLKYVTRAFLEIPDFQMCQAILLERGQRFQSMSLAARDKLAHCAHGFVHGTVLTHGYSRVVANLVQHHKQHIQALYILEGQPSRQGVRAAREYQQQLGDTIPVRVILDLAMAQVMEDVTVVLTGAEGVLENGGVVNAIGTLALATCAQAMGKPFYVAAESYKFARMYPLSQKDIPNYHAYVPVTSDDENNENDVGDDSATNVRVECPAVDFTPAKYIRFLFTDLGVLTPAAVSDELIRLYQ